LATSGQFEAVVVVEAEVSQAETGGFIACVEEAHELDGRVFEYGFAAFVVGDVGLIVGGDGLRENECVKGAFQVEGFITELLACVFELIEGGTVGAGLKGEVCGVETGSPIVKSRWFV
jgi:hypothetical protein